MKNLNSLNLGKGLSRSEMKNVFGLTIYFLNADDDAPNLQGLQCCNATGCGT